MSGGVFVVGGGLAAPRCVETLRARGRDDRCGWSPPALAIEGDLARADARILSLRGGRPPGGLLVGRPRAQPDLRRLPAGGARPEVAAV